MPDLELSVCSFSVLVRISATELGLIRRFPFELAAVEHHLRKRT